jgi:adenylate kinase family enzyme
MKRQLRIEIIGPPGHGKTTVAARIADLLRLEFPQIELVPAQIEQIPAEWLDLNLQTMRGEPLQITLVETTCAPEAATCPR